MLFHGIFRKERVGTPSHKRDPYHFHTSRDSGMGVAWVAGRPTCLGGSLEFPLRLKDFNNEHLLLNVVKITPRING